MDKLYYRLCYYTMFLLIFITVFMTITILESATTSATVIGIDKMTINYKNVLRGGYAEDVVRITTDSIQPIILDKYIEGNISSWISVNPETINISKSSPGLIKIIVEPPKDVANGNYTATIRFLSYPLGTPTGQYGAAIRAALPIHINIEITGKELKSCSIGGFEIQDFEVGQPLIFYYTVHNTGNVRVKPNINIEVWDRDFQNLLLSENIKAQDVLPTTTKNFQASIKNNLKIGQYWANINSIDCTGSGTITFDVLEVGGISDKGELLMLSVKKKAMTGQLLEVAATFKNIGTRSVITTLTGKVEYNNQIVKLLSSPQLRVNPNEKATLKDYFTPKKPGVYKVSVRVRYNNKLTFEKTETVIVEGTPIRRGIRGVSIDIGIGILLILLIAMLVLIIERKRRIIQKKRIM